MIYWKLINQEQFVSCFGQGFPDVLYTIELQDVVNYLANYLL